MSRASILMSSKYCYEIKYRVKQEESHPRGAAEAGMWYTS